MGVAGRVDKRGKWEICGDDETVLHLDYGGDYISMYICQHL